MKIETCEIFASIQGESSYVGRPAVFIRFSGCNLACSWCDTPYARKKGQPVDIRKIREKVMSFNIPLAVVTGGEPLMQKEAPELVKSLAATVDRVLVESNGSYDIGIIPDSACVIMDYKTPSSGQEGKMKKDNLNKLKEKDELKFVISDRNDFNWALDIIEKYSPGCGEILFSPVSGSMEVTPLCRWVKKEIPSARVQANLHKVFNIR